MRRSPRRREERARRIVPSFACAPGRAGADQLLQRLSLSLSSVTTVSGYLERTRDREREREAAGERTKDREREGGWGEETCCARLLTTPEAHNQTSTFFHLYYTPEDTP